jgi:hypothetical protein
MFRLRLRYIEADEIAAASQIIRTLVKRVQEGKCGEEWKEIAKLQIAIKPSA